MTTCRVLPGDLFDVLPTLDVESIDSCVTDPPYGIGFMGKEWDTFDRAKSDERLAKSKAQREKNRAFYEDNPNPNLRRRQRSPALSSSAIEYDYTVKGLRGFQAWTEQWAREVLRVLKPGGYAVVCGAPRAYHRMACGLEDAGFEIRDCLAWLFGSGFPKSLNIGEGLGTALKPAHEPIVLARKPFKGTVKGNVAKYGTGGLNIDACRIGDTVETWPKTASYGRFDPGSPIKVHAQPTGPAPAGRWPANVVLDDLAALVLDEQAGDTPRSGAAMRGTERGSGLHGIYHPRAACPGHVYEDNTGGASRFYYVAKPSREERDYGTDGLTARQRDESRKAGNPGGDNPRNRGLQQRGNCHPTVKPVALMRWLVKLVTPINGTVLDPFMGSGTTGMACKYEQRSFIGIEREAEYLTIAERRIAAVTPLFSETVA